jgi:hypothetical protein
MPNNVFKSEYSDSDKKGVIIRAAVASDYERMKRVWRTSFSDGVFGGDLNHDRHLAWGFEQNPHRYQESISQWVAEIDGEIIGAWSAMPVQLLVRGKKIKACWSQNTAIDPMARGLGLARKMFRNIIGQHRLTLGVGVEAASRPLFDSEGVQFVHADRFVVLHLSLRHVAKIILRAVYHRDLHKAWNGFQSMRRSLHVLRAQNLDVQIHEIKRFGAELDALISKVAALIPVMTYRNAEKLNWMIDNPRIECTAFMAAHSGKPSGYAIVRRDGMVLDLLVHPDDPMAFTAMLAHIAEWSRKHAIRKLSSIIPGVPKLSAMYTTSGFLPVDHLDFGLFYAFPDIKHRDETLSDPSSWYLSLADSDLWSFRI